VCPFSTSSRARSGGSRPQSKVATTPFAKLIVAERTRSTPVAGAALEARLERDVVRLADRTIERVVSSVRYAAIASSTHLLGSWK
jgi:hypothetical protein